MVDELIIDVLKEYVSPTDYHLHDWETIIERRTKYSDDVYIYHLVYGDLYLTDDLEFFDVEPKNPIPYGSLHNLTEEDYLIIDVLKEYVSSKDYDIHDWGEILKRRTKVSDEVYSYPCVYGNVMLTDDLEFFDVEPKNPVSFGALHNLTDEQELTISVLREYIPYKYREDVDWLEVLSRREEIKPNVFLYKINGVNFCLDDELNPVEYGNIHIIDDKIYYDFNFDGYEISPYVLFSEV